MLKQGVLIHKPNRLEDFVLNGTNFEFETKQMSPGAFQGEIFAFSNEALIIGHRKTNISLLESGRLPRYHTGFVYNSSMNPFHLSGRSYRSGNISHVDCNNEFRALYPESQKNFFVLVNENFAEKIFRVLT